MVRLTAAHGIASVVLSDPGSANALGEPMVHALQDAFAAIDRDASVRVVVLSGDGDTFSCGAPRELLLRLAAGDVRPTDILLPLSGRGPFNLEHRAARPRDGIGEGRQADIQDLKLLLKQGLYHNRPPTTSASWATEAAMRTA